MTADCSRCARLSRSCTQGDKHLPTPANPNFFSLPRLKPCQCSREGPQKRQPAAAELLMLLMLLPVGGHPEQGSGPQVWCSQRSLRPGRRSFGRDQPRSGPKGRNLPNRQLSYSAFPSTPRAIKRLVGQDVHSWRSACLGIGSGPRACSLPG